MAQEVLFLITNLEDFDPDPFPLICFDCNEWARKDSGERFSWSAFTICCRKGFCVYIVFIYMIITQIRMHPCEFILHRQVYITAVHF